MMRHTISLIFCAIISVLASCAIAHDRHTSSDSDGTPVKTNLRNANLKATKSTEGSPNRVSFSINEVVAQAKSSKLGIVHNVSKYATRELFAAIASDKNTFAYTESNHEDIVTDEFTTEDMLALSFYDTKSTFKLKSGVKYISLDDNVHLNSIVEVADAHLIHCPTSTSSAAKSGDVFLASVEGHVNRIADTSAAGNLHILNPFDAFVRSSSGVRNKGVLTARRVISIGSAPSHATHLEQLTEKSCMQYATEELHYLELFESAIIESAGYRPMREMSAPLTPDNGLVCNAGTVTSNSTSGTTTATSATVKCLSYSKGSRGGFSYNYDASSGKAVRRIQNLASGIDCVNCYAFLGSQFLLIVQLDSNTISVDAKVGGNAGYNIGLNVVDPSLGAPSTSHIIAPDASFTDINLGGDISLGFKFGGLEAKLSGTGGATGTLAFQYGSKAIDGYIGLKSHSFVPDNSLAFASIGSPGLRFTDVYIDATLLATQYVQLNMPSLSITSEFKFQVSPSITVGAGPAASSCKSICQASVSSNFMVGGAISAANVGATNAVAGTLSLIQAASVAPQCMPIASVPVTLPPTTFSPTPTTRLPSTIAPSSPSFAPSVVPSAPTYVPTGLTIAPTAPSFEPSAKPTPSTYAPTPSTAKPTQSTDVPTESTFKPTQSTVVPTESTSKPTAPSFEPSMKPTQSTDIPTASTFKPTAPSFDPSAAPMQPTLMPTSSSVMPSAPTFDPSATPSRVPTSAAPTYAPTQFCGGLIYSATLSPTPQVTSSTTNPPADISSSSTSSNVGAIVGGVVGGVAFLGIVGFIVYYVFAKKAAMKVANDVGPTAVVPTK